MPITNTIILIMSEQRLRFLFLTNEIDLDAKNGGAQRSKMLVGAIQDSIPNRSKFEVIPISFYAYEKNKEALIFNLPVSHDIEFAINLRKILEREPEKLKKTIQLLLEADYVFVDNCYLSPLIEFVLKQKEKIPQVIYISHNYERELKESTAKHLKWPPNKAELYIEEVSKLENFLWNHSATRIVCAINDAIKLNKETMKDFVHIPNGGHIRKAPKLSKEKVLDLLGCNSYSLFVASGHPPNVDGFFQGIGIDFGFIPRNSKLVLVGSSGGQIEAMISKTKFYKTFLKKAVLLPEAGDELLDNLYAHAQSIILPIFSGGGTSIKSAEAVLSNQQLIATKFAFRGIDFDSTFDFRIDFCESQKEFKEAITRSLTSSVKLSGNSVDILELEWSKIQFEATLKIKKILQLEK
jgi:hypothetical protein